MSACAWWGGMPAPTDPPHRSALAAAPELHIRARNLCACAGRGPAPVAARMRARAASTVATSRSPGGILMGICVGGVGVQGSTPSACCALTCCLDGAALLARARAGGDKVTSTLSASCAREPTGSAALRKDAYLGAVRQLNLRGERDGQLLVAPRGRVHACRPAAAGLASWELRCHGESCGGAAVR